MPASRTEGGGGVVVKSLPVMGGTRRRSARKATGLSKPSDTKTPTSLESPQGYYQYVEKAGVYGAEHGSEGRVRKAVCGESVRHVTHRVNCHLRWPEFKARTPRRPPDLNPKGNGTKSMVGKQGRAEDVYALVLQRLCPMARAVLPESQCQRWKRTSVCSTSERRCHQERWIQLSFIVRLA